MSTNESDCIIVGGGPAGLMLGLLLARAGIHTTVLERHEDFLRDFRGDTVHPSTQEVLADIGLLDEFLALPHDDMPTVSMRYHGEDITLADFRRLPTRRRAIAFLPQWDFLDLLARAGASTGQFDLRMRTAATGLIYDAGRVVGVRLTSPEGPGELRAKLVVAADGRDSALRAAAGFHPRRLASGMDVLWFRLPKAPDQHVAFFQTGTDTLIAIDRGEFWQVAAIIGAGSWSGDDQGLNTLRSRIARLEPMFADSLAQVTLADVHLLRVRLERLRRWSRDGLLVIGDAAHAMSPAGGVGINLAIQDAVATANLLAPRLARARPTARTLAKVQRRRALPAAITQAIQRRVQDATIGSDPASPTPPFITLLRRVPAVRHITGRIVGLGVRLERLRPSLRPKATMGSQEHR